jgi:two-component sensor histidine kinase
MVCDALDSIIHPMDHRVIARCMSSACTEFDRAVGAAVQVLKSWQVWLYGVRIRDPRLRYALPVAMVAAAFLIRVALPGTVNGPFLTFWPAVMVTTLAAGIWPGVLSLVLSVAVAWYCFIPPPWSLKVWPETAVPIIAFLLWGGALLAVVKAFRVTIRDLMVEHERNRLLIREVDHRVKNNLQFVYSILSLQARRSSETAVRERLEEAADRLKAVIRVHDQLYKGDPGQQIDLRDFLDRLSRDVETTTGSLEIKVRSGAVGLPFEKLLPLSIIIQELLANIAKYGYPGGRHGVVGLTCDVHGSGNLVVTVEHEGMGLPDVRGTELESGFGMTVVRSLVQQLGARFEAASLERGARFTLTIPLRLPPHFRASAPAVRVACG